jgi:hypothetical protein
LIIYRVFVYHFLHRYFVLILMVNQNLVNELLVILVLLHLKNHMKMIFNELKWGKLINSSIVKTTLTERADDNQNLTIFWIRFVPKKFLCWWYWRFTIIGCIHLWWILRIRLFIYRWRKFICCYSNLTCNQLMRIIINLILKIVLKFYRKKIDWIFFVWWRFGFFKIENENLPDGNRLSESEPYELRRDELPSFGNCKSIFRGALVLLK